ncbi:hypothetical protein ACIQW9_12350 [Herminiimonas sp. NPDC097707]
MSQASSPSVTTETSQAKRIAAIAQLCESRGTQYQGLVKYLHL